MTTETETVESICRELAERVACLDCSNPPIDPHFDALRGEHRIIWGDKNGPAVCLSYHWLEYSMADPSHQKTEQPAYCLRTDLDSIVETFAVATGHEFSGVSFNFCKRDWGYDVQFVTDAKEWGWHHGATKAEGAARALREAVDAGTR